eukprot:5286490-Pyramimonas_sp.AAC.1
MAFGLLARGFWSRLGSLGKVLRWKLGWRMDRMTVTRVRLNRNAVHESQGPIGWSRASKSDGRLGCSL